MPNERPAILYVFLSRKFWASAVAMLVALGVLTFSDAQQAELVAQIVGGISAVYTLSVAIEDGLSKMQRGPVQVAEAQSVNITEAKPE
jgi:hypothetical protein